MKNISLFIMSLILLSACAKNAQVVKSPASIQFPAPPAEISKCADLNLLPADAKINDIGIVVSGNYKLYHLCSQKNEAWNDWYKKQQELFNSRMLYQ